MTAPHISTTTTSRIGNILMASPFLETIAPKNAVRMAVAQAATIIRSTNLVSIGHSVRGTNAQPGMVLDSADGPYWAHPAFP